MLPSHVPYAINFAGYGPPGRRPRPCLAQWCAYHQERDREGQIPQSIDSFIQKTLSQGYELISTVGSGMKDTIKLFRIITIVVAVLGSGIGAHKLYRSVCAVQYVTYAFDQMISPELQRDIRVQVALFENEGSYNPRTIISTISEQFPCVKSISVHCRASNTAEIEITAHDPIVRINGSHILTDAKTIILDRSYALYVVDSLPSFSMASALPERCSDRMMGAVKRCIKDRIFEQYTLSWVNEHELYFQDMHDPSFSLLCDAVSLPTHSTLISYEQLKNSIKNRKSAMNHWVADLRFDDQIIVSGDKGGRYGKGV